MDAKTNQSPATSPSPFPVAEAALAQFAQSLPSGVNVKMQFEVSSPQAIFKIKTSLGGADALAQTQYLSDMLRSVESAAALFGAPKDEAAKVFEPGAGSGLKHDREMLAQISARVKDIWATYGDIELQRIGVSQSVRVAEIVNANGTADFAKVAENALLYINRSPMLQLVARLGCVEEGSCVEYPRLEVAQFMRAASPSGGQLPVWVCEPSSVAKVTPEFIKRAMNRDFGPFEVPEAI
jgi:hypothetical protein